MPAIDLNPLILTFKLAFITASLLFIICLPLAYWLAYSKFRFKPVVEAIVSLPLVLPPSVLGFYLLIAFSPNNAFGKFLEHYFNLRLVFSFPGIVVGSLLYSLPFMVHPLQAGFKNIPISLKEVSYTLGRSRWVTLIKVLLPNMRASLLTGLVLSFAHTIGEFGVVLMIGGSIPGQTRVASIAVFDEVQSMNYHNANVYAAILFAITFTILIVVYFFNQRIDKVSII